MVTLTKELNAASLPQYYTVFLSGKRHLTQQEISILKKTNTNKDESWNNIWVDEEEFDPKLISGCHFQGFFVIGKLSSLSLKYHDLVLDCGCCNSFFENVVIGDYCAFVNVKYLSNYCIGSRVILFNVQEMSCTCHSKFGNGILKQGESEDVRIWIGVANENDRRAVLPFEQMITADAYIWSKYRDDKVLMNRLIQLTEFNQSKERNTYGIVEDDVVIKNTTLIKDAKICRATYIKGAFKLKNITILSSEEEPSQIGEGVEMVNGILGYGSRVFYQAVAVRFVIGRNCQLKYGARLLNSVLGDNSTVSCCEILNNLIFPFHEQHHNSSFLIASTVCGQSNIASGATIGSNHNSRSPDGEMFAGRGFWPGLCSDFKHNSRFASFTLVSKGSYQNELNIQFPFSLVASDGPCKPIHIIPAYWFMYNMFAIARNKSKFSKRDKRVIKVQHIETDPFAPDTMQEIEVALRSIIELTAEYLVGQKYDKAVLAQNKKDLYQIAKDYLHQNPKADFVLKQASAQKKFGALILKPAKAYKEYRKVVKYFAVRTLAEYAKKMNLSAFDRELFVKISKMPLYTRWVNVGGQIMPEKKLMDLFDLIKNETIENWSQVHAFYDKCHEEYDEFKVAYAMNLLEKLYSRPICEFTGEIFRDIKKDVLVVNKDMYDSTLISRMKDFDDEFRMMTFRNAREMDAVLGTIEDNDFLFEMKNQSKQFEKELEVFFTGLE